MINVLITGIGGTNSIAVLKALNLSSVKHTSIGTDVKALNAGSFLVDKSYLMPHVDSGEYIQSLKKIIKKEKVVIVFATTEKEMTFLAKNKGEIENDCSTIVMVPEQSILQICQDKFLTQEFLKRNGFDYIPTIKGADEKKVKDFIKQVGFPLIKKPVTGYGSRGIEVIADKYVLDQCGYSDEFVLQKYIASERGQEFEEYTAEVFVNKDKSIAGGIVIERTLTNGESRIGKVIKDMPALDYLKKVAKALKILGPCNFQYRKQEGRVYIFEINARYSGTTAVRAHFGFNNVELALQSFVSNNHIAVNDSSIKEGYFIRYWEEAYSDTSAMDRLTKKGFISNV